MTDPARHRRRDPPHRAAHARASRNVANALYARGNISAIAGAGGVPVIGYGYDDLYRLISESAPGLSLAHAYDATGNRTAETVAGATTVYAYPPDSHRLTTIGGTERTFDANGNLGVLNLGSRSRPRWPHLAECFIISRSN